MLRALQILSMLSLVKLISESLASESHLRMIGRTLSFLSGVHVESKNLMM